jgi:hypothetical protein
MKAWKAGGFLLLLILLLVPVLADDSIPMPRNLTTLVGTIYGNVTEVYGSGSSANYDSTGSGRIPIGISLFPMFQDTYHITLTFTNGEIITGELISIPTPITGYPINTYFNLDGKWFNSTYWIGAQEASMAFAVEMGGTKYFLMGANGQSFSNRLVIPLSMNLHSDPLQKISITDDSGSGFSYKIYVEGIDEYTIDISTHQNFAPDNDLIGQIGKFILGVKTAIEVILVLVDFLFIKGYIFLIMIQMWEGMIFYYSVKKGDVPTFWRDSIKGTIAMFEAVIRLIFLIAMALRQIIDLINPLKWIV